MGKISQVDALSKTHPEGLLLCISDVAHGRHLPLALPSKLQPVPLNSEALAIKWPSLKQQHSANKLCISGVLGNGAIHLLSTLAQNDADAEILFGCKETNPSLNALIRHNYNPAWLLPHLKELCSNGINQEERANWCRTLDHVWQRCRPDDANIFELANFAVHTLASIDPNHPKTRALRQRYQEWLEILKAKQHL